MPKFTLDGKSLEVPAGTTILQAALARSIQLPHYCYHPKLSIVGNCRICLVEVEKAPKLLTACSTVVTEGMVVQTASSRALEGRRGVMEFLLINHPLDCPICDQAGECRLQDYAVLLGSGTSRFTEEKVRKRKRVEIGPHVLLDEERCILCTRCIRFCQEITGTNELDLFDRGERVTIGLFPGRQLENPYSGNVVDICPVGALTSREFRFQSRVWFLKPTASICPGCARGCNIWIDADGDRIARLRPRINEEVNGHWICDYGRHGMAVNREDRLNSPLVREKGNLVPSPWREAMERTAIGLDKVRRNAGGDSIGWLISGRLTNEEAFLVRRITREILGGGRIAVMEHLEGQDDDLLLRRDRAPNHGGLVDLGLCGGKTASSVKDMISALQAGTLRALVVLGEDPAGGGSAPGFREEDLSRLDLLIVQDLFLTPTAHLAHVVLPLSSFAELDGTCTNFQGRVQRLRTSKPSPGASQPGWMFLTLLGRALDGDFPYRTADEVARALAEAVPAYAGMSYPALGDHGILVGGDGGAAS